MFLHMTFLHISMRYEMSSIPWKLWDDSAKLRKKLQKSRRLPQYFTVGEKITNSSKWRFCIWPFQTFPCDTGSILWKLRAMYAKVWKNYRKRWVFRRYLTLGAINQKSFPLRFAIWSFYTFPRDTNTRAASHSYLGLQTDGQSETNIPP